MVLIIKLQCSYIHYSYMHIISQSLCPIRHSVFYVNFSPKLMSLFLQSLFITKVFAERYYTMNVITLFTCIAKQFSKAFIGHFVLIYTHLLPSAYLPNPDYIGHNEWGTLVGIAEGKAVGQREGECMLTCPCLHC